MSIENNNKIEEAKNFAIQVHTGHKRKSGEDYYVHTFRVYEKLKEIGIEEESTLVAAILHQTLDFSDTLTNELEKRFGSEVLGIIQNYKKLSDMQIEHESPMNLNEKYIMQAIINMAEDMRTIVIRLADKIDNLETSLVLSKEKRELAAKKALMLYSPLARIIGVRKLATQLENNAFKILDPGEYAKLEKIMEKKTYHLRKAIKDTESSVSQILKDQRIEAKFQSRIKHLYGIFRKGKFLNTIGKNPGGNYEDIYDTGALRIIVNKIDECYTVENILKELMEHIPSERDDYIKIPRESGYQSIHNTFKVTKDICIEVQIRTHDMHENSEYGPASHLLYKVSDKDAKSSAAHKFKKYLTKNPNWFKDLQFINMAQDPEAGFKPTTPFSKNVYAFTPKGDIIELPKGSNIIDFAYALHTDLGNACIGGFINGQLVKLTYEIMDGDRVEIKSFKGKTKPSKDWLEIVKTPRARMEIKKALKM